VLVSTKVQQRYHVTAQIEVHCPPGIEFKLEDIDLLKHGSFRDAEGALELAVGGTLGELRKLALASEPLHALIQTAEHEPDATSAIIRLEASPHQLREMAQAARSSAQEPTAAELIENSAWLRAALSFHEYEPRNLEILDEPVWP
jgi:hypothetical protein